MRARHARPLSSFGKAALSCPFLLLCVFLLAARPATAETSPGDTLPRVSAEEAPADSSRQETFSIRGRVLDGSNGEPLADCNVFIEGGRAGVTTEAGGGFLLARVPGGKIVLVASRVDFEPQRIALDLTASRSGLTIRLRPREIRERGVTVTATRARERDAPVAFANLTKQDLQMRGGPQDVPVLLSELPSTTFHSDSGNEAGYNYLSIRGFDQRRVSVLINGVPQNDPEDHDVYWVDFPDLVANVQDIQVQRGSGMAFYGPPAIGGSVNILTEAPPAERGGSIAMGAGSYGTRRLSLQMASGLVASRYLFEGRVSRIESDGYRERAWVDFKSYFVSASRVGDRSVARVNVYAGPIADHLAYYGIPKEMTESDATRRENPIARPDEIENFNQPHFEIQHEIHPRADLRITNTIFGVRGYGFYDYDGSWAPMSYFRLSESYGFGLSDSQAADSTATSLLIRAYVDNRQLGWLPQMTWTGPRTEITAGGEFRAHRSLHWGRIQKGDSTLPSADSGGYAGLDYVGTRHYYEYRGAKDVLSPYVHAVFRPHPRVSAMFDLQYAHLRYRLYDEKFIGTDFSVPYGFWNPRAGVNVNLTDRWNGYASYARTSREPRLKNLYDAAEASTPADWSRVVPQFELGAGGAYDFSRPLVKPERLHDLEAGIGYRRGGRHAVVNLYWMDFHDEIVDQGQVDRFGEPVTGNADRTRHEGIEVSAAGPLVAGVSFAANVTASRNRLIHDVVFVRADSAVVVDGHTIAGFPGTLANARLSYGLSGMSLSAAVQYVGKQYTDNFENEANTVDPYTVVHASAAYTFGETSRAKGLTLQLEVRNLLDARYNTYGEGEAFFPAARRQFFTGLKFAF